MGTSLVAVVAQAAREVAAAVAVVAVANLVLVLAAAGAQAPKEVTAGLVVLTQEPLKTLALPLVAVAVVREAQQHQMGTPIPTGKPSLGRVKRST